MRHATAPAGRRRRRRCRPAGRREADVERHIGGVDLQDRQHADIGVHGLVEQQRDPVAGRAPRAIRCRASRLTRASSSVVGEHTSPASTASARRPAASAHAGRSMPRTGAGAVRPAASGGPGRAPGQVRTRGDRSSPRRLRLARPVPSETNPVVVSMVAAPAAAPRFALAVPGGRAALVAGLPPRCAAIRIEQAMSTTSAVTFSGGSIRTTQSSRPPHSRISPLAQGPGLHVAASAPAGRPSPRSGQLDAPHQAEAADLAHHG